MSEPDGNGWMPIETAPKDGSVILGYRGDIPPISRIAVIAWLSDEWRFGDTWAGATLGLNMMYPTHWQPLPKPPVSAS